VKPDPARLTGGNKKNVTPEPTRPADVRKPHVDRQHDSVGVNEDTTTIFVGNLPWSTTSDDLDRLFSRHGDVVSADVARRRGGQSKGYGLVEMPTPLASNAIEAVHARPLQGRKLVVRTAR
jgi:RNA recognition motif-containing protein